MVRGQDPVAVLREDAPAQLADRRGGIEQQLRREEPERTDDLRPQDLELRIQEVPARRDLGRRRIAVLRRAALQDVGDVDLVPLQAD